jgi:hypothetical protein
MVYTRPPAPGSGARSPVQQLRQLAWLISGSDAPGVARIAKEANRIILEYDLTPQQILAAIIDIPCAAQLLTGHKMKFTADDVVAMLSCNTKLLLRAMERYPGKRGFVNLDKLVVDINNGKFSLSSSD